jgi:hypothetical protein
MPRRKRTGQLPLLGVFAGPVKPAPPKPPSQSEKQFMAQVIELATWLGWRHWHDQATNAPSSCWNCGRRTVVPRNAPGHPDLLLIRRPRVIWAELKAEGEHPTSDQQSWLDELAASNQEVYLWTPTPACWRQIEQALR